MTQQIIRQLDQLADFRAQRDAIGQEKQELIDQVLTLEIKAQLSEIEIEFSGRVEAVNENMKNITAEIKSAVGAHGSKVKGTFLQAVWVKGRSKWDTKGLQGYAKARPEVLEFYSEGSPYVSIRKA